MKDDHVRNGRGDSRLRGLSRRGALTGMGLIAAASATPSAAVPKPVPSRAPLTPQPSAAPGRRRNAPPHGPNVIVILLDDVGYADLGCYGGEIETPAIDSLAGGGLRYTNFRTTGVCSATRASFLTGLNPHSAGIAWLTDLDSGFPGYRGDLAPDAATLPETLQRHGYSTYHCGKWHVNYAETEGAVGPMDNWPLQRGFDRAYWFQGHSTDYFRPQNLVEGAQHVSIEATDGYYVTDALTDQAIAYIHEHRAQAPDRPFFLYLAHPGAHSPLHARREDIERIRGRYDAGWDAVREQRLARQISLGVAPPGTQLPPRNPGVAAWDSLSTDQRRLYARYMEVYAAVVERVDWNVGRLLRVLDDLGALEDTLIVLASDNGGSPDGGLGGTPNLMANINGGVSLQQSLDQIDEIGGPDTYPMYPMGWAMASNTPFRLYKHDSHLGGVADPLIVHWPKGVPARGEVRQQYVHVMDLFPTILDCTGAPRLAERRGAPVKRLQGASFRRSLKEANAPETRLEQHFEMNGIRAMYDRGWRLVSTGRFMDPQDRWELFDLRAECNEVTDLSTQRPDLVAALDAKWMKAAQTYDVFPVDSRSLPRKSFAEFFHGGGRTDWRLTPPLDEIPAHVAPPFFGRSHDIDIELDALRSGDEGVLLAYGAQFIGFVLYVRQGRLHYEAVSRPKVIALEAALPPGARRVGFRQVLTERPWRGGGALLVDGHVVAEASYERALFGRPMQGLQIGQNAGQPVSHAYPRRFDFTGRIRRVDIHVDNSPYSVAEITAFEAGLRR